MNWTRAIVAGLIATAVMTALLVWAPIVGLPKLAIGELLSTWLAVSVALLRVGAAGGWLIHAAVGVVLALIYAAYFAPRLPGGPVARGIVYGFLVFLVAQLAFMPTVGAGVFSRGDVPMLVGSLIGHVVYGALVGRIYGDPRSAVIPLVPPSFAQPPS
jgi:uncharacterized membrane protein YagU involved in acid resistance